MASLRLGVHSQIIIPKPFLLRPNSRIQLSSSSLSLKFKFRIKSGLYSSEQFELNAENVDKVLDDVRPYLIADGGNIDVVSVDDGIVSLKLQGTFSLFCFQLYIVSSFNGTGACGSCPSSTTTMKMGVERVLKEKFGDAIKDISQADGSQGQATSVDVSLFIALHKSLN